VDVVTVHASELNEKNVADEAKKGYDLMIVWNADQQRPQPIASGMKSKGPFVGSMGRLEL